MWDFVCLMTGRNARSGPIFAGNADRGSLRQQIMSKIKPVSGIKLIEEKEGNGPEAKKGDKVVYNIKIFLNRGDEVPLNQQQAERMPEHLSYMIRTERDYNFINHHTILGKRESMAAVEYSLFGMREGGYKKIKASPHLAYGKKGMPGLIPEDAVLTIELWLREVNS